MGNPTASEFFPGSGQHIVTTALKTSDGTRGKAGAPQLPIRARGSAGAAVSIPASSVEPLVSPAAWIQSKTPRPPPPIQTTLPSAPQASPPALQLDSMPTGVQAQAAAA